MRSVSFTAALAVCAAVVASSQQPSPTRPFVTGSVDRAFTGARVIDGSGRPPIDDAVIVVRAGKIAAIGPARRIKTPVDVQHIDVSGRTIVPGLINSHGHVGETRGLQSGAEQYTEENVVRQLGLYARYGITTVFSLGGDHEAGFKLRDGQHIPTLDRARLFVAGPVLNPKTPEEAVQQVRAAAAQKVDIIKIRVDDNLGTTQKMPEPVYRAVIQEAHRQKLRVAAHIFYLEDARSLLKAGVDFIAHSVRDQDVDADLIARLKARDVCYCPTLTREISTFVYESRPAFFDDPFFTREADPSVLRQLEEPKRQEAMRTSTSAQRYKTALEVASKNLARLVSAGVRIAMGTDTGPPARFQGYFEHMELELMQKAGLSAEQVLKSATSDAARCLRVTDEIGTLAVGRWADFVVVEGDPLEDITNLRKINSVWIAGNRVERKPAATF